MILNLSVHCLCIHLQYAPPGHITESQIYPLDTMGHSIHYAPINVMPYYRIALLADDGDYMYEGVD